MTANGETTAKEEAIEERKDRIDTIDFKMVTFSLAGKDYGVDIMNVKEIAKAGKFTYVPNAAPFLRGVYNLRGDIIPVIDLRVFFHLPAEKKEEDALENTLILRVGEQVIGVIVDNIDKVVGIASAAIQPPHPIFGDINIKYIRGVVENQGRLYIILDAVRIFAPKEESKRAIAEVGDASFSAPLPIAEPRVESDRQAASSDLDFIKETLFAFRRFSTTELNEAWVASRFAEWKASKGGKDLQLKDPDDADQYLSTFYSPYSGAFWSDEYAAAVSETLPDISAKNINVWNPGCGKGQETFSFACILRNRYPDARVKIWANDSDLLSISTAPNMVFDLDDVPEFCREHMTKGRNGYGFSQAIRDSIVFEYHDVLNSNPYPDLDIVLARDLLSLLSSTDQVRVIEDFAEKMKGNGILMLGRNERLDFSGDWKAIGNDLVSVYTRAE